MLNTVSPFVDVLAALVEAAPEAPGLDARCRAVLTMVLASPLAYALAEPPGRDVRQQLTGLLEGMKVSPSALAAFFGGLASTFGLDDLAEAEDAGWVESWPVNGMLAVALTPRAAQHLGVELREIGCDGDECRWVPIDPRRRPYRLSPVKGLRSGGAWLDAVEDETADPVGDAIAAERWERREQVLDEETGEPMAFFGGVPVMREHRVDHRLGAARATRPKARKGKKPRNGPPPRPRENPGRPPTGGTKPKPRKPGPMAARPNSFSLVRLAACLG